MGEHSINFAEGKTRKYTPRVLRLAAAAGAATGVLAGAPDSLAADQLAWAPPILAPTPQPANRANRTKRFIRKKVLRETGFVIKGATSTYGPPSEGVGITADQGNDNRPCIAIRDDSTLGDMFKVVVMVNHVRHVAQLLHCDWGPAPWTGRSIDITGEGAYKLHLNPLAFPTGAWGEAIQEVKKTICIPESNRTYLGEGRSDRPRPCPVR